MVEIDSWVCTNFCNFLKFRHFKQIFFNKKIKHFQKKKLIVAKPEKVLQYKTMYNTYVKV
jgi:hypothetical protein